MVKRTIEIDDNLEELEQSVIDEIKEDFVDYIEENPDTRDFDNYYQNSGCDKAHESADSNTPIYYSDIDGLYYLYSDEFEEEYRNAGFGNGTEDNHKQVAIYCYLNSKGHETLRNLEETFNEWNDLDDSDRTIEKLKQMVEEM